MWGPFLTASRILISLKIFGCRTGFSSLITTFWLLLQSIASKTSLYFPLPKGNMSSWLSQELFRSLEVDVFLLVVVVALGLVLAVVLVLGNDFCPGQGFRVLVLCRLDDLHYNLN